MPKHFTTGAVLTITTGLLLCEMGQVYEILNYLTNDNLFTHQLPAPLVSANPLFVSNCLGPTPRSLRWHWNHSRFYWRGLILPKSAAMTA